MWNKFDVILRPSKRFEKIGYLVEKNMNWYMVLSILIPYGAANIPAGFLDRYYIRVMASKEAMIIL
jgi:uncharacterized membrane protein YdjX (TVP38/TMEM64 family)